jgi:Family of unknown function (DUF6516)
VTAEPILIQKLDVGEDGFAELRIWRVPNSVRGSTHNLKYALAFVVNELCVLRYDNEAGKGDHKHIGNLQTPYAFVSAQQLITDFWKDVDRWEAE